MSIKEIKRRFENHKISSDNEPLDSDDIDYLFEQNQRLVEALEYYADASNYDVDDISADHLIAHACEALQAYKLLEKKD